MLSRAANSLCGFAASERPRLLSLSDFSLFVYSLLFREFTEDIKKLLS